MSNRKHYEPSPEFEAEAYTVDGWQGVAFHVLGWETEPDEDTEWSGTENRTGRLLVVMIGDDVWHSVDTADVHEIPEDGYCPGCGQIGCNAYRFE